MADILDVYDLEGFYLLNGAKGSHVGHITHYKDNKIIGEIRDNNNASGPPKTKKHFLGLVMPDRSIGFLKLASLESCLRAVLWHMSPSEKKDSLSIEGKYLGNYAMFSPLEIIDSGLLNVGSFRDFEGVPSEKLMEVIFNPNVLKSTAAEGSYLEHTGEINLKRFSLVKE